MNVEHFVSASCEGEICHVCKVPATHKASEVIQWDSPDYPHKRHPLTAYLCCEHFVMVFGDVGHAPTLSAPQAALTA